MLEKDLAPDRRTAVVKQLERFVDAFFDENPISQLGILTTQDKRAVKLTPLTGNAAKHKEALEGLKKSNCVGEPSLQNALELAHRSLKALPGHSSREVLVVLGSLTSCDPSNIAGTVAKLAAAHIRVSVIGLAAELFLCKRLAKDTGGTYTVLLEEAELWEALARASRPQPADKAAESSLVRIGFPEAVRSTTASPAICACHSEFTEQGFLCPQCGSKYCSLPVECRVCRLTLVTGPQLARSYAHLFPLAGFREEKVEAEDARCFGCLGGVAAKSPAWACPHCASLFCPDCDLFVHESLQTCPGCKA